MDPGPVRDALTVLAGVGTGVLSAAFGVGGAVVSTPAVRALGLPAILAVGTTLPSILPSALAGTRRYAREGMVLWPVVLLTCPLGVAAAVGGSVLSRVVPGEGHLLMILTALLLGLTALRMARKADPEPAAGAVGNEAGAEGAGRRGGLVLVAVGVLAGLLSGLLGVGGGVVMVPGFTELARMPLKVAIATSLACVAILAVPSTVAHAVQGGIDWRVALLLTLGVVPGARLGAAATLRASDAHLRGAVAVFLGVVALVYLAGEVAALAGG